MVYSSVRGIFRQKVGGTGRAAAGDDKRDPFAPAAPPARTIAFAAATSSSVPLDVSNLRRRAHPFLFLVAVPIHLAAASAAANPDTSAFS